jgi:hypothetical protein
MRNKDESRPDDFISISGSKMRKLAALGAKPCPLKSAPLRVERRVLLVGVAVRAPLVRSRVVWLCVLWSCAVAAPEQFQAT